MIAAHSLQFSHSPDSHALEDSSEREVMDSVDMLNFLEASAVDGCATFETEEGMDSAAGVRGDTETSPPEDALRCLEDSVFTVCRGCSELDLDTLGRLEGDSTGVL